jgi:DNA-binding HxlR family transcriptional regulator
MMAKKTALSEIQVTLDVIGGKWKPLILHYLETAGTKRYSEILRYLETAPKKTLTAQLRELEADKIVKRTVIPTVPVQVEYSVTEHGRSLFPILDVMCSWGFLNMAGYEIKHPTCENTAEVRQLKEKRLRTLYEQFDADHLGDWPNEGTAK